MKKEEDIGFIIKNISDALEKNANNDLRQDDLTLTQVGFLSSLYSIKNHEMTMKELEAFHHVAQSTAYGIVKRLLEKKLVLVFDDSASTKTKRVRLTELAIEKCKLAQKHMKETESMLRKNLTKEEQKTLSSLLKKVRDSLYL